MKKLFAALTSAVLAGSLASCGSSSSKSSKADDPTGKTIGISLPAQFLERWNNDGEFLKAKFEEAGYKVDLKFAEGDEARQNNDIIGMINDKVDLLLIAAVDGDKLGSTLDSAKDANIPVIAYDRLINNTNAITYYISFDNIGVGRLQATYIVDQLKLKSTDKFYNIEFVSGDSADPNATYFFKGAYEELEQYIKSGKLNVLSGRTTIEDTATEGWKTENAKADMTKILASKYSSGTNLDAVICANDSTALGVRQAIDENYKGSNDVLITGQDGDVENLVNIADGKQSMTVYKNVQEEATVTFEVCKTILAGNTPAASLAEQTSVDVDYDTETYDNGVKRVQSYLLTPYVITKDNLQRLVDTGNYKWDSSKKYVEKVTGTSSEASSETESDS